MKKLWLFIIIILATFACKKSDNDENNRIVQKKYRVTKIEGKNSNWGEYQLLVYYSKKNTIDSIWRCDMNTNIIKRDTAGYYSMSINGTISISSIIDRVLNIDADSVERLKEIAPTTYQDSLKRRRANRTLFTKTVNSEGTPFIKVENVSRFKPRADFGLGKDFNNTYFANKKDVYMYEYNSNGQPIKVRIFHTDYPTEDSRDAVTYVEKVEFTYSDDKVVSANFFKTNSASEESWQKTDTYNYTYDGDRILSIKGGTHNASYTYTNNDVQLNINGDITKITYNSDGYISKIEYSDGSWVKATYQEGEGNYAQTNTTIFDKLFYLPHIK